VISKTPIVRETIRGGSVSVYLNHQYISKAHCKTALTHTFCYIYLPQYCINWLKPLMSTYPCILGLDWLRLSTILNVLTGNCQLS